MKRMLSLPTPLLAGLAVLACATRPTPIPEPTVEAPPVASRPATPGVRLGAGPNSLAVDAAGRVVGATAPRIDFPVGGVVSFLGAALSGHSPDDLRTQRGSLLRLWRARATTLDRGFGTCGATTQGFPPHEKSEPFEPEALLVDRQGRLLVLGRKVRSSSRWDVALVRYGNNGKLDPTFGRGGRVTTRIAGDDVASAYALLLDERERIVVAAYHGHRKVPGPPYPAGLPIWGRDDVTVRLALLRYSDSGRLDRGFGKDGVVSVAATAAEDAALHFGRDDQPSGSWLRLGRGQALSLVEDDDGSLLLAAATNDDAFTLLKTRPDGVPDPTFGVGGLLRQSFDRPTKAVAVVLDREHRIVGIANQGWDLAVARWSRSGELDATFGDGGIVRVGHASLGVVTLDPEDRLLAAGWLRQGDDATTALVRFTPDWQLDRSFGTDGVLTLQRGEPWHVYGAGLATLPDGSVVVQTPTRLWRHTADGASDSVSLDDLWAPHLACQPNPGS